MLMLLSASQVFAQQKENDKKNYIDVDTVVITALGERPAAISLIISKELT